MSNVGKLQKNAGYSNGSLPSQGEASVEVSSSKQSTSLPASSPARKAIDTALEGGFVETHAWQMPELPHEEEQALYLGVKEGDETLLRIRAEAKFDAIHGHCDQIAEKIRADRAHERLHNQRAVRQAETEVEEAKSIEAVHAPPTSDDAKPSWPRAHIVKALLYAFAIIGLGLSAITGVSTFIRQSGLFPELAESWLPILLLASMTLSAPLVAHTMAEHLSDKRQSELRSSLWRVFAASVAAWIASIAYLNALGGGFSAILMESDAGFMFGQTSQAAALAIMAICQLSMDLSGAMLLWIAVEDINRSNSSTDYRETRFVAKAYEILMGRVERKRRADQVDSALLSVALSYTSARSAYCDLIFSKFVASRIRNEAAVANAVSKLIH